MSVGRRLRCTQWRMLIVTVWLATFFASARAPPTSNHRKHYRLTTSTEALPTASSRIYEGEENASRSPVVMSTTQTGNIAHTTVALTGGAMPVLGDSISGDTDPPRDVLHESSVFRENDARSVINFISPTQSHMYLSTSQTRNINTMFTASTVRSTVTNNLHRSNRDVDTLCSSCIYSSNYVPSLNLEPSSSVVSSLSFSRTVVPTPALTTHKQTVGTALEVTTSEIHSTRNGNTFTSLIADSLTLVARIGNINSNMQINKTSEAITPNNLSSSPGINSAASLNVNLGTSSATTLHVSNTPNSDLISKTRIFPTINLEARLSTASITASTLLGELKTSSIEPTAMNNGDGTSIVEHNSTSGSTSHRKPGYPYIVISEEKTPDSINILMPILVFVSLLAVVGKLIHRCCTSSRNVELQQPPSQDPQTQAGTKRNRRKQRQNKHPANRREQKPDSQASSTLGSIELHDVKDSPGEMRSVNRRHQLYPGCKCNCSCSHITHAPLSHRQLLRTNHTRQKPLAYYFGEDLSDEVTESQMTRL